MDVHVRRAVSTAFRLHSVDVLTAQEDGAAEADDFVLLQRAIDFGRVLVSPDADLLREARRVPLRRSAVGQVLRPTDPETLLRSVPAGRLHCGVSDLCQFHVSTERVGELHLPR
jgi:hypothetical protein